MIEWICIAVGIVCGISLGAFWWRSEAKDAKEYDMVGMFSLLFILIIFGGFYVGTAVTLLIFKYGLVIPAIVASFCLLVLVVYRILAGKFPWQKNGS